MKESDVVKYLKKVVKEMRGTTRKVKWEGRKHAPDLLVLLPFSSCWVETKAPGKAARLGQLREHARLRASGMSVFVLDSIAGVDEWRTSGIKAIEFRMGMTNGR
jgi:hypothetical protein